MAVTGLGLVCALGNTVPDCWKNALGSVCGITPLTDPGQPPYKFAHGGEARLFEPLCYFSEKDLLTIERFAQFAAVAAREAVAQSGITFSGQLAERTAIVTGSSVGGQLSEEEGYQRLYREGNPRIAPLTIPRTMASAGASRISLEFGIVGPSFTVSTACSSSNHAIGQAFGLIRSGAATAAIAGGSDAVFSEGLLRAWEALRVVSPDICRPFSLQRRGLSLGEGGAMLLLEEWDHASKRNAEILAEVVGFGMSSDAHHLTQPSVDGPVRSMVWALEDACISPTDIDHINAHGTGTQANDSMEASAIHRVFRDHTPNVSVTSTKSMHGHTLGAAGAVEAVLTVLALRDQVLPPTIHFAEPDPACHLDVVANQPRPSQLRYALSNSFAFGGLNATLVFKRAGS